SYASTLSLHDALPISALRKGGETVASLLNSGAYTLTDEPIRPGPSGNSAELRCRTECQNGWLGHGFAIVTARKMNASGALLAASIMPFPVVRRCSFELQTGAK